MEKEKVGYQYVPDKYSNIDEFIREFTYPTNDKFQVSGGLDFEYKGEIYHFCNYQMESDEDRKRFSKILKRDLSKAKFEFAIYIEEDSEFNIDDCRIIGFYETIDEFLTNCFIGRTNIKEVLLSKDIKLISRD